LLDFYQKVLASPFSLCCVWPCLLFSWAFYWGVFIFFF
jgi:hypothetical protein